MMHAAAANKSDLIKLLADARAQLETHFEVIFGFRRG